jgi:transposase
MVRRKLTIPERCQAVGMHNGGFSYRRVADHFRVNHSIIVRLMQPFRQTGNVTDRPRAGRPRKTTPREDRLIYRRARQRLFSTAGAFRGNLAFEGHISTRTVIRCLHHQGMRARRPIKRPQLTLRHRHARFDWSHDLLGWTIRTWRRVHWSDESIFLLRPTDGHARVWR